MKYLILAVMTAMLSCTAMAEDTIQKDANGDVVVDETVLNQDMVEVVQAEVAQAEVAQAETAQAETADDSSGVTTGGNIDGSIDDDKEAIQVAVSLVEALKNGQWVLVASALMSLLVWIVERFKLMAKVKEPVYTIAGLVLGVVGGLAVGLLTVEAISTQSVIMMIIEAFVSAGGVTLIGNAIQRSSATAAEAAG